MPDVVLYDGHCRICTAGARQLAALARPGAVEMCDFQEPGVLAAYPQLTHEQCMRAMQLVTPDGRVFEGAEAVAHSLYSRPLLGSLARLYYVPGVRTFADLIYAWVARNRYRLGGRAADVCDDAGCALHLPPPRVQSPPPMRPFLRNLGLAAAAVLVIATGIWFFRDPPPDVEAERIKSEKAELDKIRLEFLKGNWKQAFTMLQPYASKPFARGSLGEEVNRVATRVNSALKKAQRAGELFDGGQHEAGANLMDEAAREYPENRHLRFTADYYEGTVAFDRKDYDMYLRLAEESARQNPGGPTAAVWLANARATKYAVSGNPDDKVRATEAIGMAEGLARSAVGADNKEVTATLDRIRFRITSREILSPEEYERRRAARP
jgi:predicted DCC family thiol-disulfide oxidoreductase YuxK